MNRATALSDKLLPGERNFLRGMHAKSLEGTSGNLFELFHKAECTFCQDDVSLGNLRIRFDQRRNVLTLSLRPFVGEIPKVGSVIPDIGTLCPRCTKIWLSKD